MQQQALLMFSPLSLSLFVLIFGKIDREIYAERRKEEHPFLS
jgi:hypothetical protein